MFKDYFAWHGEKGKINAIIPKVFFKEREVWFCSVGLNVGSEQDGKNRRFERPVLIVTKFNKDLFLGVPLTSVAKEGPYYYSFERDGVRYSAVLSQIRCLDARRLSRKAYVFAVDDFFSLRNRIIDLFKKNTR